MKCVIGLAAVLYANAAFAEVNACDVVKCGEYSQGADKNGVVLTVSFQPRAAKNEIDFAWTYTKDGAEVGRGVRLILKLSEDESFVGLTRGKAYAAGVCRLSACTYGMFPHDNEKGGLRLQTGTFKFNDKSLEVTVFIPGDDGKDFVSKGTLPKK